MNTTPDTTAGGVALAQPPASAMGEERRIWQRGPGVPLAMCAAFVAFMLLPRVRENPRLFWAFAGTAALLVVWTAALRLGSRRLPGCFQIEFARPRKQHYIQSTVQILVYAYWGWYWRDVYSQIPLILAQLVFLYTFDALLTWTRGRPWLVGFGPLPIILSTNVFIWFTDDWFVFQFLLVATGALGKEFIKWNREGRRTHIFNPSAFTLSLFSIVLIATGTTDKTLGVEIATTIFRPPHIYLEIFLLGLIVQYFFAVTLMTLSAATVLFVLNQLYTASTGVYYFVDTNISAAVFLGFHLLVTDPSTSPRTNLGKVLFGCLYGLSIWVLYWVLGNLDAPQFYDKLLPIPILNLSVRALDSLAKSGIAGRFTRWEAAFSRQKLNLVHMGCWAALFGTMLATGFVEAPHEGRSMFFWNKAWKEGKPGAGQKLLNMVNTRILKNDPVAHNVMGGLLMDGKLVARDEAAAAHYYAKACELGSDRGCNNVAKLFLLNRVAESEAAVTQAFDRLEVICAEAGDQGEGCFLVGLAYEIGEGRPKDPVRALAFFRQAAAQGSLDAKKGIARSDLSTLDDLMGVAQALAAACKQNDAEACLDLAALYDGKNGFPRDPRQVETLLEKACALGSEPACEALKRAAKR